MPMTRLQIELHSLGRCLSNKMLTCTVMSGAATRSSFASVQALASSLNVLTGGSKYLGQVRRTSNDARRQKEVGRFSYRPTAPQSGHILKSLRPVVRCRY